MQKIFTYLKLCFVLLCVSITLSNAQNGSIAGKVTDINKQPVPGVNVVIESTTKGASSDINGMYNIKDVAPGKYTIVATFIGFNTLKKEVVVNANAVTTVNLTMTENTVMLNEIVAVGYGTTKKKDLTGSVTSLSTKDFNVATVSSPEQLIQGRVAGVQIISNSGAPGAGSRIRIRGGTSLNASNDPLIVIDGVPVDNNTLSGASSTLALINPDDIENMTVLKDASAAAIYGSRAANGVILITTKKGYGKKFGVSYNTTNSLSTIVGYVPVFDGDQFRALVNKGGTAAQIKLLGDANTNWQKEIYRTAFTTDHNISFGGGFAKVPYRVTLGYLGQEGVLKTSKMDRYALGFNMQPSLLKDKLKINLNFRYVMSKNEFANVGAIGSAVAFDPTQPVNSDTTSLGGYFEWTDAAGTPNPLAPRNPVSLILLRDDLSNVNRTIGNVQLDYSIPMVSGLRTVLNLGTDIQHGDGTVFVPKEAGASYNKNPRLSGSWSEYDQDKSNELLEFYVNYNKEFAKIKSRFDAVVGYSYQIWLTETPAFPRYNADRDTIVAKAGLPAKTDNVLLSYYGRLNYTFNQKYLLTATLRQDASSRFSKDVRNGYFPSAALAWRIIDEPFMKNAKVFSDFKLRLGYGITGQQDGIADYGYIPNYSGSNATAYYVFGGDTVPLLRPDGYDANLKWEQTATTNFGLDYGFFNGRIYGSIDIYKKVTSDLLATIPAPAGSNLTNNILTNVGSIENKGFEFSANFVPYDSKKFFWETGFNFSINKNTITKLSKVQNPKDQGIFSGGIAGGTGNTIQINSVGYQVFDFYCLQQLYDNNGNPIVPTGDAVKDTLAFADLNNDGKITGDDRYRYKNPEPKLYAGFYTRFGYKNWDLGFFLRGSFGNYVYNNVQSQRGVFDQIGSNYLSNLTTDYENTLFQKTKDYVYFSDYYVKKASFIRCDNLNLGYNFKNVYKDKISLRASFIIQNVFVITKYDGLDPELAGGIDNNIYPRPRVYSINLNARF